MPEPFLTALRDAGLPFLEAAVAALALRTFAFTLTRVNGHSMNDTLKNGDLMYVSVLTRHLFGLHRGDVVICRFPGRKERFVKRLIALPGDRVRCSNGRIFVNDEPQPENYVTRPALRQSFDEITLPAKRYFVMGDNRRSSHDSRSRDVGPVTRVIGVARAVIWPPKRIISLKRPERKAFT